MSKTFDDYPYDDCEDIDDIQPISIEMLRIICKQYPNDADLGKVVRNLVKQFKSHS